MTLESVRAILERMDLDTRTVIVCRSADQIADQVRAWRGKSRAQPPIILCPLGEANGPILRIGDVELNRDQQMLSVGDRRVHLSPKQAAIMEILMRHHGDVVDRKLIFETLWRPQTDCGERVVDVYVSGLRRILKSAVLQSLQIRSIRGRGYALRTVVRVW